MSEDRIERIEREVEELKGLLTSVILSARFRDDTPFESLIAKHAIAGDQRVALNLVLNSVLARAMGEKPQLVRDRELLDRFPVVENAQTPGAIDLADAIRLVSQVVGSQSTAYEFLRAYKDAGFGTEGFKALGL